MAAFYAACGFARGAENEQGVLMLRASEPKPLTSEVVFSQMT
jgi:hypothetical protein